MKRMCLSSSIFLEIVNKFQPQYIAAHTGTIVFTAERIYHKVTCFYIYIQYNFAVFGVLTCKLIELLTPWSRVLLEKLTGFQLVEKFPAFYGRGRFITAFTSVRHLSLSSPCPHIPLPEDPS